MLGTLLLAVKVEYDQLYQEQQDLHGPVKSACHYANRFGHSFSQAICEEESMLCLWSLHAGPSISRLLPLTICYSQQQGKHDPNGTKARPPWKDLSAKSAILFFWVSNSICSWRIILLPYASGDVVVNLEKLLVLEKTK